MVTLIDLSGVDLGDGAFDPLLAEGLGVRYLLHAAGVEEGPTADRPVFVCMANHNRCPLIPPGRPTAHGIVLVIDPTNPSHQAAAQWHMAVTRADVPVVVVEVDALVGIPPPSDDQPDADTGHEGSRRISGIRRDRGPLRRSLEEAVASEPAELVVEPAALVGGGETVDPLGGGSESDPMARLAGPDREADSEVGFAGPGGT